MLGKTCCLVFIIKLIGWSVIGETVETVGIWGESGNLGYRSDQVIWLGKTCYGRCMQWD